MKGTPAKRAEDFSHFVRKCHPCEGAYQEFLPELLATDGSWIRRAASETRQFVVQEFRAPVIADEIRSYINSERNPGSALMGYSAFERTSSVAIVHSGDGLDPGWLAMPWKTRFGEPALPALSNFIEQTPAMQLVARGQHARTSRTRLLELTLEQCGAGSDRLEGCFFHILPYVEEMELWGTYQTSRGWRQVRVNRRSDTDDSAVRITLSKIEKAFAIDDAVHRRLNEADAFSLWLEVEFAPSLFCLPREWRRWWFEVDI